MLDFFLFIFLCFNRTLAHIHTLVSSSSLSQLRSQSWQHSDHILASLGTCVHLQSINNLNPRKFILKSCKLFFVFSLRRYYLTSQK